VQDSTKELQKMRFIASASHCEQCRNDYSDASAVKPDDLETGDLFHGSDANFRKGWRANPGALGKRESLACQIGPKFKLCTRTLSTTFEPGTPQVSVELDREKARTLGVKVDSVYETLQAYLSGLYVNDIVRFGRVFKVFLQAEPEFTHQPDQIGRFSGESRT
jgi:multidrug efflux pump subunit AcrB